MLLPLKPGPYHSKLVSVANQHCLPPTSSWPTCLCPHASALPSWVRLSFWKATIICLFEHLCSIEHLCSVRAFGVHPLAAHSRQKQHIPAKSSTFALQITRLPRCVVLAQTCWRSPSNTSQVCRFPHLFRICSASLCRSANGTRPCLTSTAETLGKR
jgi:hypothetical protein